LLRFTNFNQYFFKKLSRICYPITEFTTTSNGRFECTANLQNQIDFDKLKYYFTTAPIEWNFKPMQPRVIGSNASNFAIGIVLSQVIYGRSEPISVSNGPKFRVLDWGQVRSALGQYKQILPCEKPALAHYQADFTSSSSKCFLSNDVSEF
jgi:hypothetical protein